MPDSITRQAMERAEFVVRKENLVLLGAVGTGKTHLATAIALQHCQSCRHARFYTAASLANVLLERNQKGTLSNFMTLLRKVELMVIDEVGFVPLHKGVTKCPGGTFLPDAP